MASVASQLIEEVTAHVQRESIEDVREICAEGTYFLNNLRMCFITISTVPTSRVNVNTTFISLDTLSLCTKDKFRKTTKLQRACAALQCNSQ